ncbi:ABC transporter permease [Candidatus Bathyarchaeota archaeon]|nr:ABC transporter permease [Candidatus Bathyarchaeota archaeon]
MKTLPHASKTVLYYVTKRIVIYIISVYAALTINFFLFRMIPVDPLSMHFQMIQQRYGYTVPETDQIVEHYKKIFGYDKDLFTQYINYMRELFLHGNMGVSFLAFPKESQALIMQALPWSIGLLGVATIISWSLGIILGTLVGWWRERKISSTIYSVALCLCHLPYYYLAIILVLFFGYIWSILPPSRAYSPHLTPSLTLEFIWDLIVHAILPSLSIILISSLGWLISTRALVITILGDDFLTFAHAKGLRKIRILNRYVLRNILLPQTTGLGMSLGFVFSGSFLVEWIFKYPGVGELFSRAIGSLDYNTAVGIVSISTVTVLTANLIIDLLYPFIDPRVRYG